MLKDKFIKLKNRQKIERIISAIISLFIILFLFKFVNIEILAESFKRINHKYLLLAILILPLSFLIRAVRWKMVLKCIDSRIFTVKDSFFLILTGVSLNIFLPAGMGDIAKSYYGYRRSGIKEEMLSSSLIDKLLGLLSLFVLGVFASFVLRLYLYFYISSFFSIIILILLLFPGKIPWSILNRLPFTRNKLDIRKLVVSSRLSINIITQTFFLSMLGWIVTYSILYFVCNALSAKVDFIYILAISPIITIARLIPLTINGLGTQEASVMYLFSMIGINPSQSILISLINRLIISIIPGLLGLFVIWKVTSTKRSSVERKIEKLSDSVEEHMNYLTGQGD